MTLRLVDDTLFLHHFGVGIPFRLGVEEQLFLVDPGAHRVSASTDELLAALGRRRCALPGRVIGELFDGVVELAAPVCASADEVANAL